MLATAEIAPAIIAAIDVTRMSWFLTCESSCASTPRIWSSGMQLHQPLGDGDGRVLRRSGPVANAFGCSDGIM